VEKKRGRVSAIVRLRLTEAGAEALLEAARLGLIDLENKNAINNDEGADFVAAANEAFVALTEAVDELWPMEG
jgi:hypothetical protein